MRVTNSASSIANSAADVSGDLNGALFTSATNLNHSLGFESSIVTDPARFAKLQAIAEKFGCAKLTGIKDLGYTPFNSENYEITTTSGEHYLLRIGLGKRTQTREDILLGMAAFYRVLRQEGVASSEYLLPPGSDCPIVKRENGDNCTLSPWLEVRSHFCGGIEEASRVGQIVRKMHSALDIAPQKYAHDFALMRAGCEANHGSVHDRLVTWDVLDERIFSKVADSPRQDFRMLLDDFRDDCKAAAEIVKRTLTATAPSLNPRILHRDLVTRNFLFLVNGGLALIDPEKMQFGNVYVDLGQAAWTVGRETAEREGVEAAREAVDAFAASYGALDRDKLGAFSILTVLHGFLIYGSNMVSAEGVKQLESNSNDHKALGLCAPVREALMIFQD